MTLKSHINAVNHVMEREKNILALPATLRSNSTLKNVPHLRTPMGHDLPVSLHHHISTVKDQTLFRFEHDSYDKRMNGCRTRVPGPYLLTIKVFVRRPQVVSRSSDRFDACELFQRPLVRLSPVRKMPSGNSTS